MWWVLLILVVERGIPHNLGARDIHYSYSEIVMLTPFGLNNPPHYVVVVVNLVSQR